MEEDEPEAVATTATMHRMVGATYDGCGLISLMHSVRCDALRKRCKGSVRPRTASADIKSFDKRTPSLLLPLVQYGVAHLLGNHNCRDVRICSRAEWHYGRIGDS